MQTIRELLSKQWIKRNGEVDCKMVDYILKETTYKDMSGFYLKICNKPKIDNTIYYADTDYRTGEMSTTPSTGFENFVRYNAKNSPVYRIDELKNQDVIFIDEWYQDKTGGLLKAWSTKKPWEELTKGILATPEQKQVLIDCLTVEAEKYSKRLETYYKKYSKKITTSSYWADR